MIESVGLAPARPRRRRLAAIAHLLGVPVLLLVAAVAWEMSGVLSVGLAALAVITLAAAVTEVRHPGAHRWPGRLLLGVSGLLFLGGVAALIIAPREWGFGVLGLTWGGVPAGLLLTAEQGERHDLG